jgi:hypothetical protein
MNRRDAEGAEEDQQLAGLVQRVQVVRAQREAPHVPADEAALLIRIDQGFPADLRQRYEALITKRSDASLTPEEHAELLVLTDRVAALGADRVAALAELARLRGTSLRDVMHALGIQPPTYV